MRETKIILIDDIDGAEAVDTVYFAIGRQVYEIDLSADNMKKFDADFEKWTKHARRVKDVPSRSTSGTRVGSKSDAARIRSWAKSQGIELSDRGRVPQEVRERFYAENNA